MPDTVTTFLKERYRKCIQFFVGKRSSTLPKFLSETEVWETLRGVELNETETYILGQSFRTRAKISLGALHFQFRIAPTSLSNDIVESILDLSNQIEKKIQAHISNSTVSLELKISNCCNKNCFGCSSYTNKKC